MIIILDSMLSFYLLGAIHFVNIVYGIWWILQNAMKYTYILNLNDNLRDHILHIYSLSFIRRWWIWINLKNEANTNKYKICRIWWVFDMSRFVWLRKITWETTSTHIYKLTDGLWCVEIGIPKALMEWRKIIIAK